MKKSILAVAGVAALAGVAVPFAGVNADADLTDSLSVTIGDACSVSYGATPHTDGAGTYKGTWSGNTLTVSSIINNTADTAIGKTSFKVACNNKKGYTVALSAGNLTGGTHSETIGFAASVPTAGTSSWGVYDGSAWLSSNGTVKEESSATASTTFDVTYGVATSSTQAADTYTGTAAYTLTKKTT